MAMRYPDAKRYSTFEEGLEYQDFVAEVLRRELGIVITNYASKKYQFNIGENRQGVEIKLDNRILDTGNVSIEVGEKSRRELPDYTPSGILRNDNSWLYIQGNYRIMFVFSLGLLKLLYNSGRYRVDELPTLRRFLLKLEDAKKYAALVIYEDTLSRYDSLRVG